MGRSGISKSQVSRLRKEIDGRKKTFLTRPLEGDGPDIRICATFLEVRRGGRIVSVAALIAIGVNADGRRKVLDLKTGASEAEPIWTEFLRKLTQRGMKLGISGAHEGFKAAVTKVLSATWQRCREHFQRIARAPTGRSGRRVIPALIAAAIAQGPLAEQRCAGTADGDPKPCALGHARIRDRSGPGFRRCSCSTCPIARPGSQLGPGGVILPWGKGSRPRFCTARGLLLSTGRVSAKETEPGVLPHPKKPSCWQAVLGRRRLAANGSAIPAGIGPVVNSCGRPLYGDP